MENEIFLEQKKICDKYGVPMEMPDPDSIVGVAENVKFNIFPINGLRHPSVDNTNGWYLWAGGDISEAMNFKPYHFHHLLEICPLSFKYLALSAGWRFLCDDVYEDVWFDTSILTFN
ncbi:MAG: hypothetical protein JWN66_2968 [Sphingomonas bacterium]|uniref:immunity protein Imm33 domain-containing protein n=1 Tax=Sphingomonas bacterium TaxID=1895847 RepID=UPI0026049626|nr:hypothetical protein [Sphingomonas bacterium]MDB5705852.1 hypothetical protein [Sphingomonas bacterium]